jgi:hypothetical protein
VDESLYIVGIIDWEWCMMWPVGRFYEGSNELSDEEVRFDDIFGERGRDDLALCVAHGRKAQRCSSALGPASGAHGDWRTFMNLFSGLRRAFKSDDRGWNEWKARAVEGYRSNGTLHSKQGME